MFWGVPEGCAVGCMVWICSPCSYRRRGSLGSLQLQVRLRDETVLPSHCYQPLVQLLCQEVKAGHQVRSLQSPNGTWSQCLLPLCHHVLVSLQAGGVHLVTLLDETTTAECRQDVAVNLVKLFLGQGLVKEFLDLLFELELAKPCKPQAEEGRVFLTSFGAVEPLECSGWEPAGFIPRNSLAKVG